MITTPIFNQLRTDRPTAPICRICGRVWFNPAANGVCDECFMCNRQTDPASWHCHDCGEFLAGFDRMVLIVGGKAMVLCRDHYDTRQADVA